jgi:uncharacterized protein YgiB involved in biofilm formation
MLKRIRKSSTRVTLVLIGAAALGATISGCAGEQVRRDVYASKEDCLADWGNDPKDCEPAYERRTGSPTTTHYYGRPYSVRGGSGASPSRSGKTIGTSTTSRGGFGGSGRSSASS